MFLFLLTCRLESASNMLKLGSYFTLVLEQLKTSIAHGSGPTIFAANYSKVCIFIVQAKQHAHTAALETFGTDFSTSLGKWLKTGST